MTTAQQTYDSGTTDLGTLISQGFQATELKAVTTNDNPAFTLLDFVNASVSGSDLRTAGFTLTEFKVLKVGIIQDNLPNQKPVIIGNHIRGITEDLGQDTNTTLSWQQLGINNNGTIVVSGSDTWYRVNSSTGVIETGMIIAFEYKLWTQNDINSLWHDNDDGTNNYFPFSSDTNMKYDEWFTSDNKRIVHTATIPVAGNYYWTQLGQTIVGTGPYNKIGGRLFNELEDFSTENLDEIRNNLQLSNNGYRILTSGGSETSTSPVSQNADGYMDSNVYIYDYNTVTSNWVKTTLNSKTDLQGYIDESNNYQSEFSAWGWNVNNARLFNLYPYLPLRFGFNVFGNKDLSAIAIGSSSLYQLTPVNGENGWNENSNSYRSVDYPCIRIIVRENDTWNYRGELIHGMYGDRLENRAEENGYCVSINKDATVIAIGWPGTDQIQLNNLETVNPGETGQIYNNDSDDEDYDPDAVWHPFNDFKGIPTPDPNQTYATTVNGGVVHVYEWKVWTEEMNEEMDNDVWTPYINYPLFNNDGIYGDGEDKEIYFYYMAKKVISSYYTSSSRPRFNYPVVGQYYWIQKGYDIINFENDPIEENYSLGQANTLKGRYFGWQVKLNDAGDKLAISSKGMNIKNTVDGTTTEHQGMGATGVFTFDGQNWKQSGNTMTHGLGDGTNSAYSGTSMDMSSKGDIVAISSPKLNGGQVNIFKWNGTNWLDIFKTDSYDINGNKIFPEHEDADQKDNFEGLGSRIKLSNDGTHIIMNARAEAPRNTIYNPNPVSLPHTWLENDDFGWLPHELQFSAGTYSNISPTTNGNGAGLKLEITITAGSRSNYINSDGIKQTALATTKYLSGDILTISKDDIGGVSEDLVLELLHDIVPSAEDTNTDDGHGTSAYVFKIGELGLDSQGTPVYTDKELVSFGYTTNDFYSVDNTLELSYLSTLFTGSEIKASNYPFNVEDFIVQYNPTLQQLKDFGFSPLEISNCSLLKPLVKGLYKYAAYSAIDPNGYYLTDSYAGMFALISECDFETPSVWRSTDSGANWTQCLNSPMGNVKMTGIHFINNLRVDGSDRHHLYVTKDVGPISISDRSSNYNNWKDENRIQNVKCSCIYNRDFYAIGLNNTSDVSTGYKLLIMDYDESFVVARYTTIDAGDAENIMEISINHGYRQYYINPTTNGSGTGLQLRIRRYTDETGYIIWQTPSTGYSAGDILTITSDMMPLDNMYNSDNNTIDGPDTITGFSGEVDNIPVTTSGTGTGLKLKIELYKGETTYTITTPPTSAYSAGDTITISKDDLEGVDADVVITLEDTLFGSDKIEITLQQDLKALPFVITSKNLPTYPADQLTENSAWTSIAKSPEEFSLSGENSNNSDLADKSSGTTSDLNPIFITHIYPSDIWRSIDNGDTWNKLDVTGITGFENFLPGEITVGYDYIFLTQTDSVNGTNCAPIFLRGDDHLQVVTKYIGDTLNGPTINNNNNNFSKTNIPVTTNGSGTGLKLRVEVYKGEATYTITTSPASTYSTGDTITISKDDLTYTYKYETAYYTDVDLVITLASDLEGPDTVSLSNMEKIILTNDNLSNLPKTLYDGETLDATVPDDVEANEDKITVTTNGTGTGLQLQITTEGGDGDSGGGGGGFGGGGRLILK